MAHSARGAQAENYRTSRADSASVPPMPQEVAGNSPSTPDLAARPKARKNAPSPVGTLVFTAAVLATLAAGWHMRGELYIVPGTGIGYWIGIVGSVMMLSLLLYPVRKKFAKIASLGSMHTWFKVHMITGILGPLLIILHSNFELKSVNATVATLVMLTVVASGMTGRFLYSKIHKGLYGARAELKVLLSEADAFKQAFGGGMDTVPDTMAELKACEQEIQAPNQSLQQCFLQIFRLGARTRAHRNVLRMEMQTALAARALREHWDDESYRQRLSLAMQDLELYSATVRKAAGLKFYSRLFGWWHVLHLPLFFLLIAVTIAHIVAVHFY